MPAIRSLALAYALAGADCVDVAAEPAAIAAAQSGFQAARQLSAAAKERGFLGWQDPWLMASLNDGEDPHFRKVAFDPVRCPADCPRPCESICPVQAIVFNRGTDRFSGVVNERCYGCGRCLPICPIQQITPREYVSAPDIAVTEALAGGVVALELHTQPGRLMEFQRLWGAIAPQVQRLNLIAISCPDGPQFIDYLWALYEAISPLPCALIWQVDGRPMSGDIGGGTTRAAVNLAEKVLVHGPPGFVQLAGGTNDCTVPKLQSRRLLASLSTHPTPSNDCDRIPLPTDSALGQHQRCVAGIAYGSYARKLVAPSLTELETRSTEIPPSAMTTKQRPATMQLECYPDLLWQAVNRAHNLIAPLKSISQPDQNFQLANQIA